MARRSSEVNTDPTPGTTSDTLRYKRETYALTREQREDKDMRIMRWVIFIGIFLLFSYGFLGVTAFTWRGADYVLTAVLSVILGNRLPFLNFPTRESSG